MGARASNKDAFLTEHWFFRMLLGGVLVLALFFLVNRFANDVYGEVEEYKVSLMVDRFVRSVAHIHQQWSANNKPQLLVLDYYETADNKLPIEVVLNKKGWPINIDSNDTELNCEKLWLYLAATNGDGLPYSEHYVVSERVDLDCIYSLSELHGDKKVLSYNTVAGVLVRGH